MPGTWRPALLLVVSALVLGSCQYRNKSGEVVVSRTDTVAALAQLVGYTAKNAVTAPFQDNSPPFRTRSPSFSPDGKHILFDHLVSGKKAVLTIWDIDNERLHKLPVAPKGRAWITPSFSPDGSEIIFADCKVKTLECHVAVMNKVGSNFRRLTSSIDSKRPTIGSPSLSLLLDRVIFKRSDGALGQGDIFELDLKSGTETRLTNNEFFAITRIRYLPDGRNFIFSGYGPGQGNEDRHYGGNHICIMGPDYGYELKPAFTRGSNSGFPSISSDGKKILFTSKTNDLDGTIGAFTYDLFLRTNGKNLRLTNLGAVIEGGVLSPNGETVFFFADKARAMNWAPTSKKHVYGFWLMNSDGTNMREIHFPDQPEITAK